MANGLATSLSDMDLVLILNDTYIEPQNLSSSNNSGESMNTDENSCSNDIDMNQVKVHEIHLIYINCKIRIKRILFESSILSPNTYH